MGINGPFSMAMLNNQMVITLTWQTHSDATSISVFCWFASLIARKSSPSNPIPKSVVFLLLPRRHTMIRLFFLVYQFVSLFTIGFRLETISFGWFQEIPFALWLFEFLKWPTSGDSLRAEGTERGRRNACSWYSSPGSYDGFNLRAGDCGICSMLKFVSFFFWWFFLCLFVAMTIVQPVFRNCQKKNW